MTTSLDISHRVDLKGNALQAKDLDLDGNLTVTGTTTLTGAVTMPAGSVPRFISGMGATKTLTSADNGKTIVFDRAAGTVVTLPAPSVGTMFSFYVGTQNTSATNKVITDAGTTLLMGGIYVDKSLTVTRYAANGTTHLSLNWSGGTDSGTTGGLNGSYAVFRCVNATQWVVEGTQVAGGTLATPFATS